MLIPRPRWPGAGAGQNQNQPTKTTGQLTAALSTLYENGLKRPAAAINNGVFNNVIVELWIRILDEASLKQVEVSLGFCFGFWAGKPDFHATCRSTLELFDSRRPDSLQWEDHSGRFERRKSFLSLLFGGIVVVFLFSWTSCCILSFNFLQV